MKANRPRTRAERSEENRGAWYSEGARRARAERGERGPVDEWLRVTRAEMARHRRCARSDIERNEIYDGFTLVIRLFKLALEKRGEGNRRLWSDLLQYAHQVLEAEAQRHRT